MKAASTTHVPVVIDIKVWATCCACRTKENCHKDKSRMPFVIVVVLMVGLFGVIIV